MWKKQWFLSQGPVLGAPCPHVTLTTDASLTGWGAVMSGHSALGLREGPHLMWHINCLEMVAVFQALKHFLPDLRGHRVLVRTDNTSVVSYILVDFFVSRETSQCPFWFSRTHPAPLGLVAMVQTWPSLCMYAFPFRLLCFREFWSKTLHGRFPSGRISSLSAGGFIISPPSRVVGTVSVAPEGAQLIASGLSAEVVETYSSPEFPQQENCP